MGQAGQFSLIIDDTLDRAINIDEVDCGNLVSIQLGRNATDFTQQFTGFVESIQVDRHGPEGLVYTLAGLGSGAQCNDIIVNVEKTAPLDNQGKPVQSPEFTAHLLMEELFGSTDFLPLRKGTVKDICGFNLDQISDKVNEFIPTLSFNYVYVANVASGIADLVGADWYIDENNSVVFRYPRMIHSGIKIKTTIDDSDLAYNTSYVIGGSYSVTHSTRPSDGYASQIFGIADSTLAQTASSTGTATDDSNSFVSLYHKDIAQQVQVTNSKFTNLALRLSKTGTGTTDNDPLEAKLFGRILADNNNGPDGSGEIARFTIPISAIKEQPDIVMKLDLQYKVDRLTPGLATFWIVLYATGDSEENTIRWWHDNLINQRAVNYNALRTIPYGRTARNYDLANRVENDSIYSNFGWFTSLNGPTFSYSVISKVKHLNITRNTKSMNRWRRADVKVDVPTLSDTDKTLMQYMNSVLSHSSKKLIQFNLPQVTIPLDNYFVPGTTAQFIDPLIFPEEKNIQVQIHEVKYVLDANSDDFIGTNRCEITPVWFMSPSEKINS